MMSNNDIDIHRDALWQLESGNPLIALKAWKSLLNKESLAVHDHLISALESLEIDKIKKIRIKAIKLAVNLLENEPGDHEIQILGDLLKQWGLLTLPELPSRALQHLERSWNCANDEELNHLLANIYAQIGYIEGSKWLGNTSEVQNFWPIMPCLGQSCVSCEEEQNNDDRDFKLNILLNGTLVLQKHRNPWKHSHGIAVFNQNGDIQTKLSRHYPWTFYNCKYLSIFETNSSKQLLEAAKGMKEVGRTNGAVLAVAELSGEMYYHWNIEILPRIGRAWAKAIKQWPSLKLWHNGGNHPYVKECLSRLGIPKERQLPCTDQIKADFLIVPNYIGSVGVSSTSNLKWLENFWLSNNLNDSCLDFHNSEAIWLPRNQTIRRKVLREQDWIKTLEIKSLKIGSIHQQQKQIRSYSKFVTPHGAAMSHLIVAPPGSDVYEIVNPSYKPSYFDSLIKYRKLNLNRIESAVTPLPLQEWFYEGPLSFPIDLRPDASQAAEKLKKLTNG